MFQVTKDEAMQIRKAAPNTRIVRTMEKKSKRHRYYCDESLAAIRVICDIRNVSVEDVVHE